jgi:two-component system, NtrC family, response regulator AtoC
VRKRVFIVDDEPKLGDMFAAVLSRDGYDARSFVHPSAFLQRVETERPDVVIADMVMPEMSGLELLKKLRAQGMHAPFIVMTGNSSVQTAVDAMKLGAFHYLSKPVNLEELRALLARAVEVAEAPPVEVAVDGSRVRESPKTEKDPKRSEEYPVDGILGDSPAVARVKEILQTLVRVPGATVLVLGETGTGKNLVARTLHHNSGTGNGRFMEINCAALPDNLLEAELFGYERGAFTDARTSKPGLLELADGGTVFLDEIDSMSIALQAKLLSFLESRTFRRLGGVDEIRVNTRVLCATNASLEEKVADRQFRKDLYYRINVVNLPLPALRQMGRDVILIGHTLIKQFAKSFGREVDGLTEEAEKKLLEHSWPGNVRELRNVLERAVIFAKGARIDEADLLLTTAGGFEIRDDTGWMFLFPSGRTIDELERAYILHTLQSQEISFANAADQLGISKKTLWEKRKRYELDRELDR